MCMHSCSHLIMASTAKHVFYCLREYNHYRSSSIKTCINELRMANVCAHVCVRACVKE